MALTTAELIRLKVELGFNALNIGAEPFIQYAAVFDMVVKPYLQGGAVTSSSTPVTGTGTAAQSALTLTDPTGFTAGDHVFVDVDDRQESATIQSVSGSTITLLLKNSHTGTYPVAVDGGEGIVREILTQIRKVKAEMGDTFGTGAIRAVDEVGFYDTKGRTAFGNLGQQLMYWREELASALGMVTMWSLRRGGASALSAY